MYCLTPTIIVTTSSLRSSSVKVVPASFSSSKISKNTFSFFSPVMKDFIFRAKKVVQLNKLYFSVYFSFSFSDLVLGANHFFTITNNCQLKLFLINFLMLLELECKQFCKSARELYRAARAVTGPLFKYMFFKCTIFNSGLIINEL